MYRSTNANDQRRSRRAFREKPRFCNLRISRPRSSEPIFESAFQIARIITSGNLFPRELFQNTVINVRSRDGIKWKRFLSRLTTRPAPAAIGRSSSPRFPKEAREINRAPKKKEKGHARAERRASGFELRATQPFHSVLRRPGDANFRLSAESVCSLSLFLWRVENDFERRTLPCVKHSAVYNESRRKEEYLVKTCVHRQGE